MTRPPAAPIMALFVLLAPALTAGCDRPPPAPRPSERHEPGAFDNAAAAQSIMQPKVIAESPPEPAPTPSPTPAAPTGVTIRFARGAALDAAGEAALDRLLADPALPAGAAFVLRGHSDSPGSDAANLVTSRRRATAVADYLADKGVARERMAVIALGERRPVAPNAQLDGSDDPEGRAKNRRVDVEVVPPAPAAAPAPGEAEPAGGNVAAAPD